MTQNKLPVFRKRNVKLPSFNLKASHMGGNKPHRRHDLATCSDVFDGKTVCIRDLEKPNLIWRFNFKFDPIWSFNFKTYKSFRDNNSTHFFDKNLSVTLWYTLYVVKCNLAKAFVCVIFYVPKCPAFYLTFYTEQLISPGVNFINVKHAFFCTKVFSANFSNHMYVEKAAETMFVQKTRV